MSAFPLQFLDLMGMEVAAVPLDTTGAPIAGDWYSLKNYSGIVFVIFQGAWAGGTPAVTLDQATKVDSTGTKTLAFTKYFSMTGLTGTTYAESTVTANTFNLTNAPNIITLIDVPAESLDRANLFDCVQIDIESPGANADLICVVAIPYGTNRYASGLGLPNAKVD